MRKQHICPKCQHDHILEIDSVADMGEVSTEIRPLHIAIADGGVSFFGNQRTITAGRLSAVVCKQCGYTELYTNEPAAIPVDGKYVREVVGKR